MDAGEWESRGLLLPVRPALAAFAPAGTVVSAVPSVGPADQGASASRWPPGAGCPGSRGRWDWPQRPGHLSLAGWRTAQDPRSGEAPPDAAPGGWEEKTVLQFHT